MGDELDSWFRYRLSAKVMVLAVLVILFCRCNSGHRQGTVELAKNEATLLLPTSLPADTAVSQEVSTIKAEMEAKVAEQIQTTLAIENRLDTEIAALKMDVKTHKTTIGLPTWGILGLVGMCFLFAEWRARARGYWRQRNRRLDKELEDFNRFKTLRGKVHQNADSA